MAEFEFPHVYIGCPVEVSNDPSESDKTYGWVIRPKNSSADIMMVSEGNLGIRFNCLFHEDPRVKSRPDLFKDGDRGVFRLTENEMRQRELTTRLDAIETALAGLGDKLAELSEKRGPGRSKRPDAVPAAV